MIESMPAAKERRAYNAEQAFLNDCDDENPASAFPSRDGCRDSVSHSGDGSTSSDPASVEAFRAARGQVSYGGF